ncbi:hypothetical protein JTB14_019364 [Gonioctena quinquepunctata]|nr:hypothetical protein JTB14_019364 [Gonioctena quinquepunctata]
MPLANTVRNRKELQIYCIRNLGNIFENVNKIRTSTPISNHNEKYEIFEQISNVSPQSVSSISKENVEERERVHSISSPNCTSIKISLQNTYQADFEHSHRVFEDNKNQSNLHPDASVDVMYDIPSKRPERENGVIRTISDDQCEEYESDFELSNFCFPDNRKTSAILPHDSINILKTSTLKLNYKDCVYQEGSFSMKNEEFNKICRGRKLLTGRYAFVIKRRIKEFVNNSCIFNFKDWRYLKSTDSIKLYAYCAHNGCKIGFKITQEPNKSIKH